MSEMHPDTEQKLRTLWQSAYYAVILLQDLYELPLGLQMRF